MNTNENFNASHETALVKNNDSDFYQVDEIECDPARQAFRNAEHLLGIASRTIARHLDKRVETGFSDVLKQATFGLELGDSEKVDILNRRDASKVDFAARQTDLQERLTLAFQHLALSDISGVMAALDKSSDAITSGSR